ncbi:hypothetical protein M9H77_06887 [Catharanthus roseus]|uniref:Uncharacterized protein n=1 Tax=Catharanthus roseus TaxID=4058 RepID=A0ACC0BTC7_CATRO|nr:hypothetical protein M9H77_06887 [Catharanthus roseus]
MRLNKQNVATAKLFDVHGIICARVLPLTPPADRLAELPFSSGGFALGNPLIVFGFDTFRNREISTGAGAIREQLADLDLRIILENALVEWKELGEEGPTGNEWEDRKVGRRKDFLKGLASRSLAEEFDAWIPVEGEAIAVANIFGLPWGKLLKAGRKYTSKSSIFHSFLRHLPKGVQRRTDENGLKRRENDTKG